VLPFTEAAPFGSVQRPCAALDIGCAGLAGAELMLYL
jgi:hypothetical protein